MSIISISIQKYSGVWLLALLRIFLSLFLHLFVKCKYINTHNTVWETSNDHTVSWTHQTWWLQRWFVSASAGFYWPVKKSCDDRLHVYLSAWTQDRWQYTKKKKQNPVNWFQHSQRPVWGRCRNHTNVIDSTSDRWIDTYITNPTKDLNECDTTM